MIFSSKYCPIERYGHKNNRFRAPNSLLIAELDLFDGGLPEDNLVAVDLGVGFLGGLGDDRGFRIRFDGFGRGMPDVPKETANSAGDRDVLVWLHALF
jgi:hypothetical protein